MDSGFISLVAVTRSPTARSLKMSLGLKQLETGTPLLRFSDADRGRALRELLVERLQPPDVWCSQPCYGSLGVSASGSQPPRRILGVLVLADTCVTSTSGLVTTGSAIMGGSEL